MGIDISFSLLGTFSILTSHAHCFLITQKKNQEKGSYKNVIYNDCLHWDEFLKCVAQITVLVLYK